MTSIAETWLTQRGYGTVRGKAPVGGGCIGDIERWSLDRGESVIIKSLHSPPPQMFTSEARGLKALEAEEAIRVPRVLHAEENYILLEDLGAGRPGTGYWEQLGRQLAQLHSSPKACFGFDTDNYCGRTSQINTTCDNGYDFFGRYRLLELGNRAVNSNLLPSADMKALETLAGNLSKWIPDMPPVLIHGDLWSGNIHSDREGNPALIDPAAYWGWAEAELAMTTLFGGFDARFYHSYQEAAGIDAEWQRRAPIYNLYHLLNHLLLFGGSYLHQVQSILSRFR